MQNSNDDKNLQSEVDVKFWSKFLVDYKNQYVFDQNIKDTCDLLSGKSKPDYHNLMDSMGTIYRVVDKFQLDKFYVLEEINEDLSGRLYSVNDNIKKIWDSLSSSSDEEKISSNYEKLMGYVTEIQGICKYFIEKENAKNQTHDRDENKNLEGQSSTDNIQNGLQTTEEQTSGLEENDLDIDQKNITNFGGISMNENNNDSNLQSEVNVEFLSKFIQKYANLSDDSTNDVKNIFAVESEVDLSQLFECTAQIMKAVQKCLEIEQNSLDGQTKISLQEVLSNVEGTKENILRSIKTSSDFDFDIDIRLAYNKNMAKDHLEILKKDIIQLQNSCKNLIKEEVIISPETKEAFSNFLTEYINGSDGSEVEKYFDALDDDTSSKGHLIDFVNYILSSIDDHLKFDNMDKETRSKQKEHFDKIHQKLKELDEGDKEKLDDLRSELKKAIADLTSNLELEKNDEIQKGKSTNDHNLDLGQSDVESLSSIN